MQEYVFQAALAGLLHDIGKYLSRASPVYQLALPDSKKGIGYQHAEASRKFAEDFVPAKYNQIQTAVQYHHQPELLAGQAKPAYELARLVRLADQLAGGGVNGNVSSGAEEATLAPILAQVELLEPASHGSWRYQPHVLELDQEKIFPVEANTPTPATEAHQTLWTSYFQPELAQWKSGANWAQQAPEAYFTTLMALLRRHLSFVPATSPWPNDEDDVVWPDVSLFDHLKVTAAIAACLADNFEATEIAAIDLKQAQPLALLVRGDLSGIQDFIYRITEPEADAGFEHVAKRLRGRSFYLSLLGEVLADWLVRQMELPAANVLFVGGGQFDLLLPLKKKAKLQECLKVLTKWLLDEFYGELGLQVAAVELTATSFGDMRPAYQELTRLLEAEKLRKWDDYLHNESFLIPDDKLYHRCRVCHITPRDDPGICDLCQDHTRIGQRLPHTTHLAFAYDKVQWPHGCVTIPFATFGVTVGLLNGKEGEVDSFVKAAQGPTRLAFLNPKSAFVRPASPQLEQTFSFLANAAPVTNTTLRQMNMHPVERGDVLHFDAIAELSTGAKRIGILKADVDRLGLLFREGLAANNRPLRPTLSRVIALSSSLDLFFAGWLNELCREVSEVWLQNQRELAEEQRHPWYGQVDGLFYVMYSGGDDLFIVGPWDETLTLAERLQSEFTKYACYNPNFTISAGFVQVKPHYPVQRFAKLVDEAEGQAKAESPDNPDGRNRVTVFGQTVPWTGEGDFAGLMELGKKLQRLLETKEDDNHMPRTLLHDLGRLYRAHRQRGTNELKPMWTPRIFYTMARRLSQGTLKDVGYELVDVMANQTILIPVSYASLITRKE